MKTTTTSGSPPPLHSLQPLRRRHFNRLFAAVYTLAILSLLYHHVVTLLRPTSLISFLTCLLLLVSDAILAYMWSTTQAFRMNPVRRQEFPEKLEKVLERKDFPALDIFICTADPYKEPPMTVVNTALSVMAYDYPTEKLSVYVSDDGGSELTMFAFMEAAKFAMLWLPFCRENNIMDRCPDAYFSSNYTLSANTLQIKMMYESMKMKVESAVERGKVSEEYISSEKEGEIVRQFRSADFSRQNHPSVIEVLINSKTDVDNSGESVPTLVYISREKRPSSPHHFKAGALNALVRVSSSMSNAPIILTLDCDMYSNDPSTARRMLCYFTTPNHNYAYVQFPQRYHGLNRNRADIYASEHKRLFLVNPMGFDGLHGPNYVGTGCFFRRRALFGGPTSYKHPELPDNYESQTNWGYEIGFRYGSLVEDYYTGYRLQCEGWKSAFCDPSRAAFLGDVPITIIDALNQLKRWSVGLLEVGFSKYSPLTFGVRRMGFLMGQCYAHYAFWPIWSIPVTIYAFLPSSALLQGLAIFPKVYESWFFLYVFLFLGAYGQDCYEFISTRGTFERWWSDQRMWLIRATSAFCFGGIEYISKRLGLETRGFNVTSKVMDEEQSKRYDQGIFEFGIESLMFVPLAAAANLNLIALLSGFVRLVRGDKLDIFLLQIFIAGFGVLNSLPFYEAMFIRRDKGRMPIKTTITSTLLLGVLYGITLLLINTSI